MNVVGFFFGTVWCCHCRRHVPVGANEKPPQPFTCAQCKKAGK